MAMVLNATQIPDFNDPTSSDIVVKLYGSEGEDNSGVLHLHQSFLVKQSPFFAAQLSDRWTAACTERDERGRPVYSMKGCTNLVAFADAMEIVYKLARSSRWENHPGEAFTSFEDAARCLVPADLLGLESVSRAAAKYLESVAWTSPEKKAAVVALTESHLDNPALSGLRKRLAPPPEDQQAELWDELLKKACPLTPPGMLGNELSIRDKAREFITTSLRDLLALTDGAPSLLGAIRRRLFQLKDELSPRLSPPRNSDVHGKVSGLMSSLEWILRLSLEGADVRADVADLLASLDPSVYVDTSNSYGYEANGISSCVHLLEAVADGGLVLSLDVRVGLLKIVLQWAFREILVGNATMLEKKEQEILQGPFPATLATLEWSVQKNLLARWLPQLMQTWQPWFKEWMRTSLVTSKQLQVRKDGSTPTFWTCNNEHPKTSKADEGSKNAPESQ